MRRRQRVCLPHPLLCQSPKSLRDLRPPNWIPPAAKQEPHVHLRWRPFRDSQTGARENAAAQQIEPLGTNSALNNASTDKTREGVRTGIARPLCHFRNCRKVQLQSAKVTAVAKLRGRTECMLRCRMVRRARGPCIPVRSRLSGCRLLKQGDAEAAKRQAKSRRKGSSWCARMRVRRNQAPIPAGVPMSLASKSILCFLIAAVSPQHAASVHCCSSKGCVDRNCLGL